MTAIADIDLDVAFDRLVASARETGYARLTPSGLIGKQRPFTPVELNYVCRLIETRLGVRHYMLGAVVNAPSRAITSKPFLIGHCSGDPPLNLYAERHLTAEGLKVDFTLQRT